MDLTRRHFLKGGLAAAASQVFSPGFAEAKKAKAKQKKQPANPEQEFIDSLHLTVGQVYAVIGGKDYPLGSGVLLDKEGRVFLTAHQVISDVLKFKFFNANDGKHLLAETAIELVGGDLKTDGAIFTMRNPPLVKEKGLRPAKWAEAIDEDTGVNTKVVSAGFAASAGGQLHIVQHELLPSDPSQKFEVEGYIYEPDGYTWREVNLPSECKIQASNSAGRGDSGGGLFDVSYKTYLGPISSVHENKQHNNELTSITPIDAARRLYDYLVSRKGTPELLNSGDNSECHFTTIFRSAEEADKLRRQFAIPIEDDKPHQPSNEFDLLKILGIHPGG